jgi:hypothetical protein
LALKSYKAPTIWRFLDQSDISTDYYKVSLAKNQ